MITIKELARLAGVSHGTVSNVLNGKGNVSLEKVQLVEQIASQFGYTLNAKAKQLRKGATFSLAVILPNITQSHYCMFFNSLKYYVESQGYLLHLYITNDISSTEQAAINSIATLRVDGVISITCTPDSFSIYEPIINNQISLLFVERKPLSSTNYMGFDYMDMGYTIAQHIKNTCTLNIGILTGFNFYSCEKDFVQGLSNGLANDISNDTINITHLQSEIKSADICKTAFQMLTNNLALEMIFTTNIEFAKGILSTCKLGSIDPPPSIISLAPLSIMPCASSITTYYLDYRYLAKKACACLFDLINNATSVPINTILPCKNISQLPPKINKVKQKDSINVITLDCPSTTALIHLAPIFTKMTGIDINFSISSYSELYETIKKMNQTGIYDVLRMDITSVPWLSKHHLLEFDCNVYKSITDCMLPNILQYYTTSHIKPYVVPFDPSIQLLFYRKDLFEDPKVKRMYYEMYHSELLVPSTFQEYNQVASFFTKSINPNSPIEFGTSIVSGMTSGIVCEYLPRFYALEGSLFDKEGMPNIASPAGIRALRNYKESLKYSFTTPDKALWSSTIDHFVCGHSAMTTIFSNHASNIMNIKKFKVSGVVGYSSIPGQRPLVGGGAFGISKYSKKQDLALDFIKWACSEEISNPLTLLGGFSPCASIYDNLEILETYPWLNTIKNCFQTGVYRNLCNNKSQQIEEYKFQSILGLSIKSYLSGMLSEGQALQYAQDQLRELLIHPNY